MIWFLCSPILYGIIGGIFYAIDKRLYPWREDSIGAALGACWPLILIAVSGAIILSWFGKAGIYILNRVSPPKPEK